MTVGLSAVTMVKNGRVEDAIANAKQSEEALKAIGAANVRTMLLSLSTPIRIVTTFEAEDQAALGAVMDKWQVDSRCQEIAAAGTADDGPLSGYLAETWIEV